jgi:DNA-binding HxlR family transcriptional regulator
MTMPKRASAPQFCMGARALQVVGEQWTLLIIRDAFFGIRNFDDFQRSTGVARNVLSQRLAGLVEAGVMTRHPARDDKRKIEYRLTERGIDLFPVIVGLSQWGRKHLTCPDEKMPFAIVHRETGAQLAPIAVRTEDGREVDPRELRVTPGPGITDEARRAIPALREAS